MTVVSFLESIIGIYVHGDIADWEWICAAAFLMLVTWGIIIVIRSVVSRV